MVNMNHREYQCAEYDIFIIWNFPQGLGLKVKIGSYLPCFQQSQQLHISEDLDWATEGTSVGIPQFEFFSKYLILNYEVIALKS